MSFEVRLPRSSVARGRSTGQLTAQQETPYARRLAAAGLVCVGKSAASEFGVLASSESLLEGVTHNPWDLAYSAGDRREGARQRSPPGSYRSPMRTTELARSGFRRRRAEFSDSSRVVDERCLPASPSRTSMT